MKKLTTYIYSLLTSFWLLFAKEKEVKTFKATKPLGFDLQFFSDGGDGGEGGDDSGEGGTGDDEPFATFKSKDDLNKRLSRAEKKGQKALAEQLGFDSVEDMLAVLKKKEPEPSKGKGKDGKEPGPVDVDALLESKLKEEREKTFKRLVNSEVKVLANELGFADWEDALALADLSEVKEDDKGNIAGVKEALEALAKKKPHLLKQAKNGSFGANIPNNGGNGGTQKTLEEIKKLAQNRGTTQTQAYNPWA
ncbi:hypothetical protein B4102_3594 [Heyndrickxia sporothermodurans]|uniref:Scaffolding protein n=1 Tax=Heyndrickxia sporothermodurans TaxID=46224 RepID=A0A150KLK3_9BACI|nr:scaffolding protein [Heyndrickxia sporothermodurans]KYC94373.1 hypothetical protein B4102_3594 [Heyndrickxia sporothermodurans]